MQSTIFMVTVCETAARIASELRPIMDVASSHKILSTSKVDLISVRQRLSRADRQQSQKFFSHRDNFAQDITSMSSTTSRSSHMMMAESSSQRRSRSEERRNLHRMMISRGYDPDQQWKRRVSEVRSSNYRDSLFEVQKQKCTSHNPSDRNSKIGERSQGEEVPLSFLRRRCVGCGVQSCPCKPKSSMKH